jgi:hypothetical protein
MDRTGAALSECPGGNRNSELLRVHNDCDLYTNRDVDTG